MSTAAAKERIVALAIERHDHGGTCDTCYFVGARGGPRRHCKTMREIDAKMVKAVCAITCLPDSSGGKR